MDDESSFNPYAAPEPLAEIEPPPPTAGKQAPPYWLWLAAVLINLPVPVMFGIATSRGFGRIGMPVGIFLVTAGGWLLCRQMPDFMRKLSRGSILTALCQFYPVIHIFIGMFAVTVSQFGVGSGDLEGVFEVIAATLITGLGLIILSIGFGYLLGLIGSLFKGRRSTSN